MQIKTNTKCYDIYSLKKQYFSIHKQIKQIRCFYIRNIKYFYLNSIIRRGMFFKHISKAKKKVKNALSL